MKENVLKVENVTIYILRKRRSKSEHGSTQHGPGVVDRLIQQHSTCVF